MKNLWPTIKKLLKALEMKGELYLLNREMVYSADKDKMCTAYRLCRLTPAAEYFANHPEKKRRKKDVREFVKEEIVSTFRQVEVLLVLVAIYKGGDG